MKIKAANGKELPAHEIIAKSLREMKSMILESLNETIGHAVDKVLWIVTVPAIWSPGAKQIMREAANEVCFMITSSIIWTPCDWLNKFYSFIWVL